jgi:hypothetical protein
VNAVEPLKRYLIDYQGFDDTEMHLESNALGDPWDINDPNTDPLAESRIGAGWDKAFSGHYELTGRITGEARIRGKTYAVDCIDTADRSWGVRDDRTVTNITWRLLILRTTKISAVSLVATCWKTGRPTV